MSEPVRVHFTPRRTEMSFASLPAFNEAHPPFADSIDVMPPIRTESGTVGTVIVEPIDFDLVHDPAYPWEKMPTATPREREARDQVRNNQRAEVAQYIVTRERLWELAQRLQFAERLEVEVTHTQGIETTHEETETRTRTEVIGLTLGLELSGNLFSPGGGGKAAAARLFKGARAQTSAEFTYELTNELQFQKMDSQTYRRETSITTRTEYAAQAVYYVWQLSEALQLSRKRTDSEISPVSDIVAATGFTWTDKLSYAPPPEVAQ